MQKKSFCVINCAIEKVIKIEKVDIMSKVSVGKVVGANGRYNAQNQL